MKQKIAAFTLILFIALFSGCSRMSNYFGYQQTAKEFTEALLAADYDRCMSLFALEHEAFQDTDLDTMRTAFPPFRALIVDNLGDELNYALAKYSWEFKYSTIQEENHNPKVSTLVLQLSNDEQFATLSFLFDDVSGKIIHVQPVGDRYRIPNMMGFWLFGLLALCVLVFNIYVINRIRKSSLKLRWLKYLTVLIFNVPAFTYTALGSFSIAVSFQFMLGISFSYMGYLNSFWTFGLPLGGLYWLWRLRTNREEVTPSVAGDDPQVLDSFGPDVEEE